MPRLYKWGLRAPNPDILLKSLWLTWISRLLIPDETKIESGKSIPSYCCKKFGGLNFLLRCNYDFKYLEKSGFPIFYRKILANFLEIRNLYQHDNGQDLIFFHNKDILIDGNSFFLQKRKENRQSLFNSRHLGQRWKVLSIYVISGQI